jgi:hypothetical protein
MKEIIAMTASTTRPVLFIGGSGVVGTRAARALRRLQPDLPITIGARDLGRAEAVARDVGGADAIRIDLERRDLGLPVETSFSAVVVLLKDATLHSMRYAQAHGLPYVSFSDWVFDIAPEVALYVHAPASAPVLLLGHLMGGTVTLATLHFAREFRTVDAVEIGGLFDDDDVGGPTASIDMDRLSSAVPRSLLLRDGKWLWVGGDAAARQYSGTDGIERRGQPFPMLDVVSLAAATGARSVRVDFALREAAHRPRGQGPSLEVIIEIEGQRADGTRARVRHEIIDGDVFSTLSARGAALAVERLLGLAGGPPVPPGLYHPESVLDPAYVVNRLGELGTQFRRA